MTKRLARVHLYYRFLEVALQMPKSMKITNLYWDHERQEPVLIVEDDHLPPVPHGHLLPILSPLITATHSFPETEVRISKVDWNTKEVDFDR